MPISAVQVATVDVRLLNFEQLIITWDNFPDKFLQGTNQACLLPGASHVRLFHTLRVEQPARDPTAVPTLVNQLAHALSRLLLYDLLSWQNFSRNVGLFSALWARQINQDIRALVGMQSPAFGAKNICV